MEQLEKNNAALREDVDSIQEKIDKLLVLFQAMASNENILQDGNSSPIHTIEGVGCSMPHQATPVNAHPNAESAQMYRALEERLEAIEGFSVYGSNALDMCLVPDVVVPPKFKVPDFEKYKGIHCPRNHLKMFCRKMAAHATDEKLMIHVFQDSLSGASLDWYMQLERTQIQTWKDLTDAFMRQYKYNLDMAPNRMQLQSLTQKSGESFKEYAQRWRELAAHVQPPLLERELVDTFMSTLQGPYYEKMIGNISSGFADMVVIGERIEEGLKSGKIQGASNNQVGEKKFFNNGPKKKEGEANAVQHNHRQQQNVHQQKDPPSLERKNMPFDQVRFDPIPMSYGQILPYLIQKGNG